MSDKAQTIELDGLEVHLYRHQGKLIVDLDTSGLEGNDVHKPHDIPNIRLRINEQGIEFQPDGTMYDIDEVSGGQ